MTSPLPVLPVLFAALGAPAGAAARRLLGRLRRGARIPPPWCEIGVALAWAGTGAAVGLGAVPGRWLPALLGVGWLAVAAGTVDLLHHRLPDALTLPALPLALLLLAPVGPVAVLRGAAGAAVALAAYGALHLAAPAAMGGGDVKLAAPLGAVLGAASWPALLLAGTLAALLSGGLAVALLWWCGPPGVRPVRLCRTVQRGTPRRRTPWRRARPYRGRQEQVGPSRSPTGPGRRCRTGAWAAPLPHGPSMLLATWLVTTAVVGGGARGP
jgi:leader peptidase (prepilin peptidase) / N-methyltransferase